MPSTLRFSSAGNGSSICSAGGSFGQFFIVPLASILQNILGDWRPTMWALTAIAVLMIFLAAGLNDSQAIAAARRSKAGGQTTREALSEAFAQRSYILLVIGYFVCGFHVAFVGGHLPAYISDKGISLSLFGIKLTPAELGGWAIGMVGLFNIVGAVLWSSMVAKFQRKNLLSLLYLLRSLVFLGFVVSPLSAASVLIFAGALGFLWLGTVPLTSGLVSQVFGTRYVATLFGFVFLGHQLGSLVKSCGSPSRIGWVPVCSW